MQIQPGDRFGRYEIRSALGAGGMGEVFRAYDPRLGREVAIKLIGAATESSPTARARFEQEARSASALNHPNIVTIYDVDEEGGTPFIVMELLEGQSLRRALTGPLDLPLLLKVAIQTAEALAVAHDRGIIHRDLKPENVFLTTGGTAKLLDFGLARMSQPSSQPDSEVKTELRLTVDGAVLGTMGYAAPELLSGMTVDARSDIFSFGAMLYEMASGTAAFRRATPTATLAATLRDEPPSVLLRRADLPSELGRLISRCLAKEPSQRYRSMIEVRDALQALLVPHTDALLVAPAARAKLPAQRTRLIGRQEELQRIEQLVVEEGARLVTLTGPGGSGKTRLALAAAARLQSHFAGAVYFVPLASVQDPARLGPEIAANLGVTVDPSRPAMAAVAAELNLSGAAALLVLDNFEQLIGAATAVGDLLVACPNLSVIVTSREILRIYGEYDVEVPPLALPSSEEQSADVLAAAPAVELFIDRASRVDPNFRFEGDDIEAVVEICRRLDGLPLALELAAARVRTLPPRVLLTRLHQRLQILTSGSRDLPDRQHTLRRTIDWSYSLLTEQEQVLFRRLSVFVGGFTLEASEAVADPFGDLGLDLMEGVTSLVDKSLLQRQEGESGDARFGMLETIREYAASQLGRDNDEAAAARRGHAAYYLVLSEEGAKALARGESPEWLARFAREHDNCRAALESLLQTGNAEWGLRLGLALFHFWERSEHLEEGHRWLQAFLQLPGAAENERLRARALFSIGVFAAAQGDRTEARLVTETSLALYRRLNDDWGTAVAQNALGLYVTSIGEYERAARYFEETLATWLEIGDQTGYARSLSNLAIVRRMQLRFDEARRLYEEAAAVFEKIGDRVSCAWSLNHQGDVARDQKLYDDAIALYSGALQMFRGLRDEWGAASCIADLGTVARYQGDLERARTLYRDALLRFVELRHRRGVARVLELFAVLAAQQGAAESALTLGSAAERMRQEMGAISPFIDQHELTNWLEKADAGVDAMQADEARTRGAAMTFRDAIEYAVREV